jgi:hypothetical protein
MWFLALLCLKKIKKIKRLVEFTTSTLWDSYEKKNVVYSITPPLLFYQYINVCVCVHVCEYIIYRIYIYILLGNRMGNSLSFLFNSKHTLKHDNLYYLSNKIVGCCSSFAMASSCKTCHLILSKK